jgi:UDP-GlcNAc:undecaprenyl-phosphate/decaprenyl-phosphate GlcNAc-1-phosphate transferase
MIVMGVALLATLAVTPIVRRVSVRAGIVDRGGGRKVHTRELSRLGGVGMFTGIAAALAAQYIGERSFHWTPVLTVADAPLLGALAGLALIFVVGLVDDLRGLRPGVKFVGQLLAAAVPIAAGLRVEFIGNPFDGSLVQLGLLSYPVTALWIVGFANVINLIDGLDGLAAGIAAIAATSFLVLAIQMNMLVAAVLAAAVIGVCVGFLRYNFNPASIIMGDSGSLTLGFALACMSLQGVMKSVAAVTLAVPLLVIGVPVFDTASAIIRRWLHGRPIQEADNGHIHHRLLHRGFNQRQTVLIIYTWSLALAVGGYSIRLVPTYLKFIVFLVLATLSGVMASWLGLFERARLHGDGDCEDR